MTDVARGEKPMVGNLFQTVTYRAGGLALAQLVAPAGAARVLEAAAAGGITDHALYAAGRNCKRCGGTFSADAPVRRTVAGGWRHDVCPAARP